METSVAAAAEAAVATQFTAYRNHICDIMRARVELVLWHTVCWLLFAMPLFKIFSRQFRVFGCNGWRKTINGRKKREKLAFSKYSIVSTIIFTFVIDSVVNQMERKQNTLFNNGFCEALMKSPRNDTNRSNFTMKRENYMRWRLQLIHWKLLCSICLR